jgi:hypothetical protein
MLAILYNQYEEYLMKEIGDLKIVEELIIRSDLRMIRLIIAKTQEELQDMVNRLVDTGKKYDMEINIHTSQVMRVSRSNEPLQIKVNNRELETLRQRDKSRINSSQMRFLRSFSGVTLRDRIKSEEEEMECRRDIQNYQLKWNQNVLRMPENRIPRKALQYRRQGKRDLGRPYRRWKDQFM